MLPLIKWPGGKTSELKIIDKYLPKSYNRYIEPFFGGGALFFNKCPKSAIINDISQNLMNFYSCIKSGDERFKNCIEGIAEGWEKLKTCASACAGSLSGIYRNNPEILTAFADVAIASTVDGMADVCLPDLSLLRRSLDVSVKDKLKRIASNESAVGKLSEEDLKVNILTGFTAGFYTYIRTLMNKARKGQMPYLSDEFGVAAFFFVREYCYGSMFRYNRDVEFNIPYGGISYNNKDFGKKVAALSEAKDVLAGADIYCRDFAEIFDLAWDDDFIFLDPPYDTDFSEYEANAFGKDEHVRLSECVLSSRAKCLLIIKNTKLIGELYEGKGLNIFAFDNKYSCCVRGRNDRDAEHLIITNYAE